MEKRFETTVTLKAHCNHGCAVFITKEIPHIDPMSDGGVIVRIDAANGGVGIYHWSDIASVICCPLLDKE